MNKHPLVAIVVLNYNGKKCLSRALQSLERLDYTAKKIIIVDNASEDDSFAQAKRSFPRCVFLQNDRNLGFAAGMNVGIREAFRLGAEYIWLFNNDAEAEERSLRRLVDFCEKRSDAGAVSPVVLNNQGAEWFASGEISYFRMRAVHGRKKSDSQPYESECLSGCAVLFRRLTLETVGLLDERYFLYYEDADISLRIRGIKQRLFVIPAASVRHGEQSEQENPKKIYHLVLSGLLFFHTHTPASLRPWVWTYECLRRVKNRNDIFWKRKNALEVKRAYDDYDRISRK